MEDISTPANVECKNTFYKTIGESMHRQSIILDEIFEKTNGYQSVHLKVYCKEFQVDQQKLKADLPSSVETCTVRESLDHVW